MALSADHPFPPCSRELCSSHDSRRSSPRYSRRRSHSAGTDMDGDLGRRADRPPATERYFLSRGVAVLRECAAKFSCPGGAVPGHDRYGSGLRDRSADCERSRALTGIRRRRRGGLEHGSMSAMIFIRAPVAVALSAGWGRTRRRLPGIPQPDRGARAGRQTGLRPWLEVPCPGAARARHRSGPLLAEVAG